MAATAENTRLCTMCFREHRREPQSCCYGGFGLSKQALRGRVGLRTSLASTREHGLRLGVVGIDFDRLTKRIDCPVEIGQIVAKQELLPPVAVTACRGIGFANIVCDTLEYPGVVLVILHDA